MSTSTDVVAFPGAGFPAIPPFELAVPGNMEPREAPSCLGTLQAVGVHGFIPNVVVGFDRVSRDLELDAVAAELRQQAISEYDSAEIEPSRSIESPGGTVRVVAHSFIDSRIDGRLYQMTGYVFGPRIGEATRDLFYLTATCTMLQLADWGDVLGGVIASIRFADVETG